MHSETTNPQFKTQNLQSAEDSENTVQNNESPFSKDTLTVVPPHEDRFQEEEYRNQIEKETLEKILNQEIEYYPEDDANSEVPLRHVSEFREVQPAKVPEEKKKVVETKVEEKKDLPRYRKNTVEALNKVRERTGRKASFPNLKANQIVMPLSSDEYEFASSYSKSHLPHRPATAQKINKTLSADKQENTGTVTGLREYSHSTAGNSKALLDPTVLQLGHTLV